ncbi:MAG: LemA family protein [Porticoccus sp.]
MPDKSANGYRALTLIYPSATYPQLSSSVDNPISLYCSPWPKPLFCDHLLDKDDTMTVSTFILLGLLILLAGYAVTLYNNLLALKHRVTQAWSNIDVLLKQRHDELPKLVETCKQYMQYEQETLEKVINARSMVSNAAQNQDLGALGVAETALRSGLGRLFALAEDYPELRANQSFQNLQSRISDLENSIADRRELYNDVVNLNNIRIEQVPDVFIANFFKFGAYELLEFAEEETADVDIKELFGS